MNPQQAYQQNQITTAPPRELVLLLYNAGIKYLQLAKISIQQKEYEKAHHALLRGQDILTELILGLDYNIEIANQLDTLYNYMKEQLVKANVSKNLAIIDEVMQYFVEFRDTWKQAIELAKTQGNYAEAVHNGA